MSWVIWHSTTELLFFIKNQKCGFWNRKPSVKSMIGYILLVHAIYSAYEYNQLPIQYNKLDIVLELCVSLFLIFVQSTYSLKSKGQLSIDNQLFKSNYLKTIFIDKSLQELDKLGINEYSKYEGRVEFIDLMKMKQEYNVYKQ